MAYSPPPASALDFAFWRANYVPPPASAVNFDLSAAGGIYYPPPPGIIVDSATPWNPAPPAKHQDMALAFNAGTAVDSRMDLNADQGSSITDEVLCLPLESSAAFTEQKTLAWDPVADKAVTVQLVHEQAAVRDAEVKDSRWANASQQIDHRRCAPFLVKTPWKDRTKRSAFHSVDLYGETWRRRENLPAELAKVTPGLANLGFQVIRNIKDSDFYELAPAWEQIAIQPKDSTWCFSAGQGIPVDRQHDLPWGPSGSRDTTLIFVYPDYPGPIEHPQTFNIPTLRFYIVANNLQIIRVSDGRDIPCKEVSLSTAVDSYTWAFGASLAKASAKALVEGTDGEPIEVDVTINGNTWRVLVDAWGASEAWQQNNVTISGRSRSAYLAAPYAVARDYTEASTLLAQQLAAQELPPGWNLDWSMTDWIIPAGAFYYQNQTPIEAIARLAAAGGGFVNVHPNLNTLEVKPLLPASPWDLPSLGPDFQIPHDVMIQRSGRKKPGLGLNGVYVLGGAVSPYHGEVFRRGTNGTPKARTIVDSLITDQNPAAERGRVALAETLRQSQGRYDMPLSASLGGLIPVGSLLEVGKNLQGGFLVDWQALVRGVSVSARATRTRSGGAAVTVRQGLDVVRYYEI